MKPSHRALLQRAGVSAFLSLEPVHIRYITGLAVSHGVLLADSTGFSLFLSDLYKEAGKKGVCKGVKVRPLSELNDALKRKKECGFEEERLTFAALKRLKKQYRHIRFKPTSNVLEDCRRSKDPKEIAALKKADRITQIVLDSVPTLLTEGITEQELAWELEGIARSNGAEGLSFPAIVAFGTHTSRPHHVPTSRKLKHGDLVQIDIGALYKGYCGDRSAVFFTGEPTEKQARVLHALERAQKKALKAIKAGVSAAEIDAIARSVLKKEKLDRYFVHSLGHGVGLEIHEGATLSGRSEQTLQKGEVVTVEPGVYFPGKWGMRVECVKIVK